MCKCSAYHVKKISGTAASVVTRVAIFVAFSPPPYQRHHSSPLPHGEVPHPSEVHSSTDWQYSSRRRHHKPTRRLPTSSTRNRLAWEGPSPDQDLLLHVGTEVACRDLAPSLPSMKTDTLGKQDRCCGCWCPPSVLAVLFTPVELFLLEAVETEPASSQIGSDGKSPTACTCTTGD